MLVYDRKTSGFVERDAWVKEGDLDRFLVEHPRMLGRLIDGTAESRGSFVPLAATPIGAQEGRIDLLGVHLSPSQEPELVLCEDKRTSNDDLKTRAAMGQLLEYAANLERLGEVEFEARVRRHIARPGWGEHYASWRKQWEANSETVPGVDLIVSSAVSAYRAGRLLLVWCADEFPRDFVETIRRLGDRLAGVRRRVRTEALDVTQLGAEDLVTAKALASLVSARDQIRDDVRGDLDARLAKLLAGEEATLAFAELKPLDDRGDVVAGRFELVEGPEASATKTTKRTISEFLGLWDADPSRAADAVAVRQILEALTAGVSGVQVRPTDAGVPVVTYKSSFTLFHVQEPQRSLADSLNLLKSSDTVVSAVATFREGLVGLGGKTLGSERVHVPLQVAAKDLGKLVELVTALVSSLSG